MLQLRSDDSFSDHLDGERNHSYSERVSRLDEHQVSEGSNLFMTWQDISSYSLLIVDPTNITSYHM